MESELLDRFEPCEAGRSPCCVDVIEHQRHRNITSLKEAGNSPSVVVYKLSSSGRIPMVRALMCGALLKTPSHQNT